MTTRMKALLEVLDDLKEEDFERFKYFLKDSLKIGWSQLENANRVKVVDLMLETDSSNAVEVTKTLLKAIKRNDLVEELSNITFADKQSPLHPESVSQEILHDCKKKLKSKLKEKCHHVFAKFRNLNEIYTELLMVVEWNREDYVYHELIQLENTCRNTANAPTAIICEDIFKVSTNKSKPIRTVLTKGVAGIGKTVLTWKFTLDWAEDKENKDIHFTFPFSFKQLNELKEEKFSMVELIHHFFTETKKARICSFDQLQVVFIFDGLDECRLPLNFISTKNLNDVKESNTVDVLIVNLIRGELLPSAHIWITTRPAAASRIPSDYLDRVTEVKGFTDLQKRDYFMKRFKHEKQANRIISHIKTSQSFYTMCSIPVFCWITATVLEKELKTRKEGELPKTMTELYTHFLVIQAKQKKVKYEGGIEADSPWSPDSVKIIESLGRLAFEQLKEGKIEFYEPDLSKCGIDDGEALMESGVFTQNFEDVSGMYFHKVFCFTHLTVQEFMAALHVHQKFVSSGVNLLEEQQKISQKTVTEESAEIHFYQKAVEKALQSPDGKLDLLLRFLLGLSLQTNQTFLRGLLAQTRNSSQNNQKTVQYIRKKIREKLPAETSINLFHCLNELNDHSLEEEIQQSLRSGSLSTDDLYPAQWSALVSILLSSEKDLDVFDLKKYSASEEALLKLLPVVTVCNRALLGSCNLSERICEALSSVLSSHSASMRELDLSNNNLKDPGVKILSDGLKSPQCRLETLRLSKCLATEEGCTSLASALMSNPSHLRVLDLSNNSLKDSGVKTFRLGNPDCRVETLSLSGCLITEEACASLASSLRSSPSHLRVLDLSNNNLKDSGVKTLGLENPHCRLEILSLSGCLITEDGCAPLASALKSNPSYLRELNLNNNSLKDSGVKILSTGLKSPHCRLETLRLSRCLVREEGCSSLALALRSNPSHLKELDLSNNQPGESVVKILSSLQEDPDNRLETLSLQVENPVKEQLLGVLQNLEEKAFKYFQWFLINVPVKGYPATQMIQMIPDDTVETVDLIIHKYGIINAVTVTSLILNKIKENIEILQKSQPQLKYNLKKRFQCVFEGMSVAGKPALLNQIYTDLYMTEEWTGEPNSEHEVRQIETAFRKPHRPETTIRPEDIFKGSPGRDVRTVLTKGVASIGKTVLTQKFTLDWAEGKANQDIQFTFPFTFRELNVLKEKKFSLVELLHYFFIETKEAGICNFDQFQVLFIFDGLDECRLPLDFHNTEILTDVTKSTSVDVLLTSLIRGKLLPSAHLWITTRPAAASHIPRHCVGMVTEVRGFTDPQKEEYFRKRFRDEEQASRIISHMKTSQSLHIMCHIPVFCWLTATVLEDEMKTREGGELPKTLTQMYIHFLVVQTKVKKVKYEGGAAADPHWSPETRKMIESLGKLAFEQLQKGNLIFYELDLAECGIDIRAASMYSGVFTQVFREERSLYRAQVFCFIHLSVQEFLAALHVHLTFINSGVNLMEEQQTSLWPKIFKEKPKLNHLHQSAVNKALQSPNGHLDLFLRFLLGLSLQTNQHLLKELLIQTGESSQAYLKTVQYIKEKISENLSAERSINLFHCLNELNDHSVVEEIQQVLRSGSLSTDDLSPAQWSALVFILLSSEEDLDVFDLKKYSASEEALLRLLPVVKACKKALLSNCNLSERSCEALSSVLSTQSSCLTELDLSNNDLKDSGVALLSAGLKRPYCRLATLSLSGCLVTEKGCSSLASALTSNPSHLRELDLSYNHPGELGVSILSALQEDPQCRLETLRVDHGGEQMLKLGLRKYFCQLEPDTNSMHRRLKLSDNNRKVTCVKEDQNYADHPDRFDYWAQLLCRNGLTGRCYWEVEWRGEVSVSVSYRGTRRKGDSEDCRFGWNNQSWSLICSEDGSSALHNKTRTPIAHSSVSHRIGVYVDCPAGILSFYRVSSDRLIHIHTFKTTFTEPLYPGFRVGWKSSVFLCSV
ncbi:uncharacterized protein KZ484_012615 [Pholidichthys leucotaenia]